jgi:predicted Zn-dependent protease with MMP-like domain
MEYPMICWNFGRPDENGVTSEQVKNGMMGVVIHEVGHNFSNDCEFRRTSVDMDG